MDSDLDMESKLITLLTQLLTPDPVSGRPAPDFTAVIIRVVTLLSSIELDTQTKPETELMSLITQAISLFNSMDLASQPKPLSKLISRITSVVNSTNSYLDSNFLQFMHPVLSLNPEPELISVITQLVNFKDSGFDLDLGSNYYRLIHPVLRLNPEPELLSLMYQIFSHVVSLNSKWNKLISLHPQAVVSFEKGKFHEKEALDISELIKWDCLPLHWKIYCFKGEEATHFLCLNCNGKHHEEYKQAPVEIKHPLHPKHPLQLVMSYQVSSRECYCCEKDLLDTFYFCSVCDYAMNIACVEKPPILAIDNPKRHEHTLVLFPRLVSLTCNVCALDDTSSAIYMCPPCDFFVHIRCINLPRVIKISRHFHRLSFTPSFHQRDLSCGVCRKKIDNDYGGYSCIKDGCSYAVHSRCATQRNLWDGRELEGEPEEIEEEILEPFVSISDGVIQHFCHQQHHLTLDKNMGKDYDDKKQCQACITPIYFGNFYSCMECDFILHEECANLSRKMHHPVHPHMVTLVGGRHDGVIDYYKARCSACELVCKGGFFYKCKECHKFKVHVQCATVSEPLVHGSHMHPLFLTSKPEERRICSICKGKYMETFNCIECDFALCYKCATVPEKVRYKHDKHMLTLSYGKEISSTMTFWCEACEGKINPEKRFYTCDEYCCVTLHMECTIGKYLHMKPASSWYFGNSGTIIFVLPNNNRMSRPICFTCRKHCPYKIAFRCFGLIVCSLSCFWDIEHRKSLEM